MSLWQKLKEKLTGDGEHVDEAKKDEEGREAPSSASGEVVAPPGAKAEASSVEAEIERAGGGPFALELLERARGTANETRALSAVLRTWTRSRASADAPRLSEPLAVTAAEILVERGEEARALEVLAGMRSTPALMLAADLAAAAGDYPRALGAIERVIARDLASPGALERHARWVEHVGAAPRAVKRNDEATMIAPAPRSTSFTILREVARGGAGAVYEAMDEILGRRVAFKVYHREGEDRTHVEREVRLAAKLAGAGIVRVLDASPESGWIALEWVGAGSLREWIREARDELAPIERWAVPLSRALGRVHRAGLVHLDVKPGNVLMRERDEPLLTDFGIARELGEKTLGGSAGYLSPERLAGAPASAGDDLYGFGRILEDALDALSRSAPSEDTALRRVVERCLAPTAQRFASAEELTAALCR